MLPFDKKCCSHLSGSLSECNMEESSNQVVKNTQWQKSIPPRPQAESDQQLRRCHLAPSGVPSGAPSGVPSGVPSEVHLEARWQVQLRGGGRQHCHWWHRPPKQPPTLRRHSFHVCLAMPGGVGQKTLDMIQMISIFLTFAPQMIWATITRAIYP